jgi:hypothetical protein
MCIRSQLEVGVKCRFKSIVVCHKGMEDDSGNCTGSLACKLGVFGNKKERNNPDTYNCAGLYMESPLERRRELGVLIITQNVNCPMFYMLPAKQEAGSREQEFRGRGSTGLAC